MASGAGGWWPIGDGDNPFAAVFDGHGHSISNLASRRSETFYVGLFGTIGGGAAIRGLGLIDNLADYTGSSDDFKCIGGLAGCQGGGSITASYATGAAVGGYGDNNAIGGLVGLMSGGSITASWATGAAAGGGGGNNYVGGLVGGQDGGPITASYATGAAAGGDGGNDYVGGLAGFQENGSITASYATGAAAGGDGGNGYVGGLVGFQENGSITASYATGAAAGGDGGNGYVGGLVGFQENGSITASYATGAAAGGDGGNGYVGGLVGFQEGGSITASYGFGGATGEIEGSAGSTKPPAVDTAAQLTAANAGSSWHDAGSNTLGAWDFGDDAQIPALQYADYDGEDGSVFDCDPARSHFPAAAAADCNDGDEIFTLLPGQDDVSASGISVVAFGDIVSLTGSLQFGRVEIRFWEWRQLAGPEVALSDAKARETTFTAPLSKEPMLFELTATDSGGHRYRDRISLGLDVDRNDNGLIEIDSLLDLHNMRHNLAGTSYRASDSTTSVGNSFGCPGTGCKGYELMQDLDFDGDSDGGTWSENNDVGGDDGYTLDSDDSNVDYFPVDEDGAGGWLPIGDGNNPFAAVFDGNGNTISNLAISRDQIYVGFFGRTGASAAIRNLGLVDNLADYSGSNGSVNYIGGLAGYNNGGLITASYVTGVAAGGDGDNDRVGGLVGWQSSGSITASYATGAADGRDGNGDRVGGLVGHQFDGIITASYATGVAAGGDGKFDYVGGLVGHQVSGIITASYATGPADGGDGGDDKVGGLVGYIISVSITASYATGAAAGGDGDDDKVGGLVGHQEGGGSITASYATGAASGEGGGDDSVGGLVGLKYSGLITASYGFGEATGEIEGSAGSTKPPAVDTAAQLTAANAGSSWDDAGSNTLGAWDFGTETQIPALNYADYDDGGDVFACADFPAAACGTLLPGQRHAVVVSVVELEVDEGGSASYTLRLASAPTGRVEVRVLVPPAYRDSLTASPPSLFFDEVAEGQAEHWGTDQRVTLTLEDDQLSSGMRVVAIGHALFPPDPNYDGVEAPSVEVTLIDDDPLPGLRLVLVPATAAEGSGGTDGGDPPREETGQNVIVRVTAELEGPARSVDTVVTLAVGAGGDSAGEDEYRTDLPTDATLTIPAAATASDPLGFIVTLFQDLIDEGDRSFTITAFNDLLGAASATFVIADDDRAGIDLALRPRNLRQGEEIPYRVALASEPTADVEVAVAVLAVAGSGAMPADVTAMPASLTFTPADWHEPQTVILTAAPEVAVFGGLEIQHSLSSQDDPTYNALPPVSVRLELTDVDTTLQSLELRLAAVGEPLALLNASGEKIGFSANVQQYFAPVPFPAASAFIAATPAVAEGILMNGEVVQRQAEVRIFRGESLDKGEDVAGASVEVNLPGNEDRFTFNIEVSVPPLQSDVAGEATRMIYTLSLTRALPDDAELLVYLAADAERQTPITDLDFGPAAGYMDLIFILSRGVGGISYSIGDIEISGSGNRFAVAEGGQMMTEVGGFETPVTLGRQQDVAEDVPYSLTFTATPERPPRDDAADDANRLSAAIAGTLKANVDTETEISATYRSHSQGEEKSLGAKIRVSANGPVTITLNAGYLSGGNRAVGPSDFTFSLAGGAGSIQGNILEILPGQGGQVTVEAAAASSLGERINPPNDLVFTVSFESPRALIRPAADRDPLLAFSDPFFAFVGEGRRLPLEVVLTDGSTPLAGSGDIVGKLPLTVTLTAAGGGIPAAAAIAAGDSALPGRDLEFEVEKPKNSVTVEVAVASGGEDERVKVVPLSFRAHFLSLQYRDKIEFRGDAEVFDIILQGEDPDNDSWTFEIINAAEFEGHGYRVEEVALGVGTRTYGPSTASSAAETRSLRVTRSAKAVNSRIVLEFKYFLDGGAAGVFTRAIQLTSGREASLEVAVSPETLVVAKGRSGQARLVISNLGPDEDPTGFIVLRPDHAELAVELLGSGTIDRINSRFEQILEVEAAADADQEEYTLRVEVRLPGQRAVGTEFTVDINDAPQYKGETELTVYESGDDSVREFPLSVVDLDGGKKLLAASDLRLEVVGFESGELSVDGLNYEENDYFALEAGAIKQELEGDGDSLALTLTLSGKLATPFNSVVELRLFGVTDGFDVFEQRLTVEVKNRPPQFELAQTQGIEVFLEREPAAIRLEGLEQGSSVLVLEAPDDLVVKFDETNRQVTLRRLDTDLDEDQLTDLVQLAALDAQGGRTEVSIQVERPPLLPRIVPPNPLLIAAGQSGARLLQLAAGTALDVTWTVAVADGDDSSFIEAYGIDLVADGNAELSLTAALSAAGQEFELLVTAAVPAAEGGYQRTARLPVAVVAAKAKPHLKLSATLADPAEPAKAAIVSSFALTEALSIEAALEGEVPSSEELGGVTTPSFQISIFKLADGGAPEGRSLTLTAASAVAGGKLEIEPVPVGEQIRALNFQAGEMVAVSIGHLPRTDSTEVSDEIIAGASLILRVSTDAAREDADNDGLADGGESAPAALGPITAAVARVTDSGVESRGDDIEVSLYLGNVARSLDLAQCGGLSLTLSLSSQGDSALTGCGGAPVDGSQLSAGISAALAQFPEGGDYQIFDLLATFDSSEAGVDEPLVISLPPDPQQPHAVYRFDEDEDKWVLVLAAGLPGRLGYAGLGGGGQGALADFESDCGSCFYAFDLDRDGSVQLLLLLVPIVPDAGSEFALDDAGLEGRQLEISAAKTETIALVGFEGLRVEIRGVAIAGGSVAGHVSDGGAVELIGRKRTGNGPEEVLVEAFDEDGRAVATISLYVRVPNQPPEISFMLPSGEELTTSLALAANSETVLAVIVEDLRDGDQSFVLDLRDEDGNAADGRGVATLVSRLSRGLGAGSDEISHGLILSSMGARAGAFEVSLGVTDLSDGSESFAKLTGCVLDGKGQCPASTGGGSGVGSGGGGGGSLGPWALAALMLPLLLGRRRRRREFGADFNNRGSNPAHSPAACGTLSPGRRGLGGGG